MVLQAPCAGVIIERNISRGEVVVDNTLNLFTVAKVDRLAVLANIPEDDLPTLQEPQGTSRGNWTVQTVGVNSMKGCPAPLTRSATSSTPTSTRPSSRATSTTPAARSGPASSSRRPSTLPPPADVVEIPVNAIVDDGRQSVVFVQADANKAGAVRMRRVG